MGYSETGWASGTRLNPGSGKGLSLLTGPPPRLSKEADKRLSGEGEQSQGDHYFFFQP